MAKSATQVLQLVMEAVSRAPQSQHRQDLLRKLRIAQDMASSFGLDVPVTAGMSEAGRETLKNSPAAVASTKRSPARRARKTKEVNNVD